jgi:peptidoglycan/LPS O-acetylase OafA/YrhL
MTDDGKPQTRSRVPELDGIRGLAICLVLYEHYVGRSVVGTGGVMSVLQSLRLWGISGVDLFFVLSGFLIGGILMDHRGDRNYFNTFYLRRCCRILPTYFLLLAGYAGFRFLLAHHSAAAWYQQLFLNGNMPVWAYATFTQNFMKGLTHHVSSDWFIVTWSLVVEEQFYLCLPLMLWLLRPSTVVKVALIFICLNPLLYLYLRIWHTGAYEIIGNFWPVRGNALLMGVICAYALRQDSLRSWLVQNRRVLNAILIIFMLGMAALTCVYARPDFDYERILFFDIWLGLAYTSLLLVVVANREGAIAAMLRFPLLRRLGTISYSLYLFHMPINGLLHGWLLGRDYSYREPADVLVTIAAFVITLIFTTLSWHFLERPIVTWGHRFLYGKPEKNPAA